MSATTKRTWNTEEDSKLLRIILSKANLKIDWPTVAREVGEDRTRVACQLRWQRIMAKMMNKDKGAGEDKVKRKRTMTKVKKEGGEDKVKRKKRTMTKVKVKKEEGELEEDELEEDELEEDELEEDELEEEYLIRRNA